MAKDSGWERRYLTKDTKGEGAPEKGQTAWLPGTGGRLLCLVWSELRERRRWGWWGGISYVSPLSCALRQESAKTWHANTDCWVENKSSNGGSREIIQKVMYRSLEMCTGLHQGWSSEDGKMWSPTWSILKIGPNGSVWLGAEYEKMRWVKYYFQTYGPSNWKDAVAIHWNGLTPLFL